MSWTAETRAGIVWSGAAFMAGKAMTFVATLVLARLLTPADFGVAAAILVYLTMIELVSDLGMQATVVYEQEEGVSERVQTAFTINLALVALLTGLAILLAPLAADLFNAEHRTGLFRLGAANLLIVGLGNIPDGLLLREMDFRRRTRPLLVRALVSGTTSIVLAAAGLGPEALVIGLLAGSGAWTLVLWAMTPLRPRLSLDREIARSMAGYGLGATAIDGMSIVGSRVDQAAIGPPSARTRSASTWWGCGCPTSCSATSRPSSPTSRSRRWRAGGARTRRAWPRAPSRSSATRRSTRCPPPPGWPCSPRRSSWCSSPAYGRRRGE